MTRHFIWDFDGTLYDTYPHTLAAFCETFRRRGVEIDSAEAYRRFKVTMWDAFRYYGVDEDFIQAFYAVEDDLDFEPKGAPFPGIPALLEEIVRRGGRNYLYTHRDRVSLAYLRRDGLEPLFAGFITREDGFPLKPAPDALRSLLRTYALAPGACLMIGDRAIDVQAAAAAGIPGCLFDPERTGVAADCLYRCDTVPALSALTRRLMGASA